RGLLVVSPPLRDHSRDPRDLARRPRARLRRPGRPLDVAVHRGSGGAGLTGDALLPLAAQPDRGGLDPDPRPGDAPSMIRRFRVGQPSAGTRLDVFLASACSDLSRSRIQKLTEEGAVRVGGGAVKRSHVVRAGEEVAVDVPEPREVEIEPEAIPISILYEDEHLLAIDKPAGLVVHPSPGHGSGTLVNAL